MGMMQEFKDFAVKGNVMDLAVGVIIGAAFGTRQRYGSGCSGDHWRRVRQNC